MQSGLLAAITSGGALRRPAPVPQPVFAPPFDPDADGCLIHTTLPPEYRYTPTYDIRFWRGDISGVTPAQPMPPISGAAPNGMTLSYQAPAWWNQRAALDRLFDAHALRNLSHFHFDQRTAWDYLGWNAFDTYAQVIGYAQQRGFWTSGWVLGTSLTANSWVDAQQHFLPFFAALKKYADPTKHILVYGEELNSYTGFGETGLNSIIQNAGTIAKSLGMLTAVHYTANYRQWMHDDQMAALAPLVDFHLWQGDPYESPALQGARMYDSRRWWPTVAPNVTFVAFEQTATRKYRGEMTEQDGRRIGYELNCCPIIPGDVHVPPVSGGGDGIGWPDGRIW